MNQGISINRLVRQGAVAAGLLAALLAPRAIEAQGAGTVTGVVTTKAAAPKPLRVTMDQRVCGNELPDEAVVVDAAGHLANAVVTLAGVKAPPAADKPGIMNEKCRFAPRVQVVRPNATITTSSKDPILHTTNAQIDGGRNLFNVAVPVPGITIAKPIGGAGLVRLVCNTHPWMRGFVSVTDDLAAVTPADGTFTLSNVPAGTYELRIWHESLKSAPQKVTVAAGQTATVAFDLK
jgi:plastocyanin